MDIFVRTRGGPRELDYQFVGGEAPADFWWREYGQVTDVERPTILLRSDGAAWQAYVAGIRSRRLDATDNAIQFNLVLAGECGPGADSGLALAVISRSAADLAKQGGQFIPGDHLDGQLPGDEVERLLRAPGRESAAAAAGAVRAGYGPLVPAGDIGAAAGGEPGEPDEPGDAGPPVAGDWIAILAEPRALGAFTALAGELLGGTPGRAVALNLIADSVDPEELPAWDGTTGVLAAGPGEDLETGVRPLGKAGSPRTGETRPPVKATAEKTRRAPRETTERALAPKRRRERAAPAHRKRLRRPRTAMIAALLTVVVTAVIVTGVLLAIPPL